MTEVRDVEELVAITAGGDSEAWGELWERLEPMLSRLARSPRVSGRLSASEDDCRNIVVEVMSRLRDDEFRRLKLYLAARRDNGELTFEPWLRVVARRVTVDYLRGHGEYIDRRRNRKPGSAPGKWVEHTALSSRLAVARPAVTNKNAAMTMLRFAYRELPRDQMTALERWIVGTPFDGIASELDLPAAADANKLVRAALQRLRREFRVFASAKIGKAKKKIAKKR